MFVQIFNVRELLWILSLFENYSLEIDFFISCQLQHVHQPPQIINHFYTMSFLYYFEQCHFNRWNYSVFIFRFKNL